MCKKNKLRNVMYKPHIPLGSYCYTRLSGEQIKVCPFLKFSNENGTKDAKCLLLNISDEESGTMLFDHIKCCSSPSVINHLIAKHFYSAEIKNGNWVIDGNEVHIPDFLNDVSKAMDVLERVRKKMNTIGMFSIKSDGYTHTVSVSDVDSKIEAFADLTDDYSLSQVICIACLKYVGYSESDLKRHILSTEENAE